MIKRLRVSNFRSLGSDLVIEFEQLTVFVGQNGAGKSNIMDALLFVADALHMGLQGAIAQRAGIQAVRRWSDGHPLNMRIGIDLLLPTGPANYEFEIVGDKKLEYRVKREIAHVTVDGINHYFRVEDKVWTSSAELRPSVTPTALALPAVAGDARFAPLADFLKSISTYSIFPDTLRRAQKYDPSKPMLRHGENWASILHDQPEDTWKPDLIAAMQKLTGDVQDIKVERAAGLLVPRVLHASGSKREKWFDVGQESDGTLRAAGIITALLQEPPVPVIGVEEPELTIHPGAVSILVDYLRQASRKAQVIVCTHSPEMLDLVGPDEVRVVTREAGITGVRRLETAQVDAVRNKLMSLGELQRTIGLRPQLDLDLMAGA